MDTLRQDLRYAVRTLRKAPGFTLVAILTLALGIGATTAIFTVVNAALLRPLPYPQADRIVQFVWRTQRGTMDNVTDLEARYWSDHTQAFQATSVYDGKTVNLAAGAEPPEQVLSQVVSSGFFDVLGVHPFIGRDFSADDDRAGAPHVAIIDYGLWQRRLGGRQDVLGQTLTIDDVPFTIVGVMPAAFRFVAGPGIAGPAAGGDRTPEVWTPRQVTVNPKDQGHNASLFGRIRPGVPFEQARADVTRLDAQFRRDYPGYLRPQEIGADLKWYRAWIGEGARTPLLVLLGAALLVLLIAAANVASLLVARQAARETELAVRRALGASRWRVFGQVATESALLAMAGGGIGVLLSSLVGRGPAGPQPGRLPAAGGQRGPGPARGRLLFRRVPRRRPADGVRFGLPCRSRGSEPGTSGGRSRRRRGRASAAAQPVDDG